MGSSLDSTRYKGVLQKFDRLIGSTDDKHNLILTPLNDPLGHFCVFMIISST